MDNDARQGFEFDQVPSSSRLAGGLSRRHFLRNTGLLSIGLAAGMSGLSACGSASSAGQLRFLCDETDPKSIKALKDGFASWEKTNKSFKVDAQFLSPDEFNSRVPQLIGSGDPPDIIRHTNSNIAQYLNSDWLAPVTDVVRGLGDVADSWRIVHDGEDYAVPMDWTCWMQFYRKDIFDAAGVEPALTWEKYKNLLEALSSRKGIYPNLLVTADSSFADSQMLNPLWENQCALWSWDGRAWQPSLAEGSNLARAVEALEYFKFRAKYSPASGNFDWPEVNQVYGTGKIAMIEYFGGRTLQLLQEQAPDLLDKTGVAPMTSARSGAVQGDGSSFAIFKTTKDRVDASRDLLAHFMASPSYLNFLWSVPTQQFPPQISLFNGRWREHKFLKARPDFLATVEACMHQTYVPLKPPGAPAAAAANILGAGFLYSGPLAQMNAQVCVSNVEPRTAVHSCAEAMNKYAKQSA